MHDSCLAYLDEEYYCPHCQERLSCCNAPPVHVGDGLGWGSEILFICLNDDCPLFVNGWKHVEEQYGHSASYRHMQIPGGESTSMMVGGKDAFKGCIVDKETIQLQNERYQREKEAVAKLDTCVAEHNLEPVLFILLDEAADRKERERACDLLVEVNDLSCVDPIRNHTFKDTHLAHRVNLALNQLLKKNFRKECSHCAEIIKMQAKVCNHCQRDL